MWEERPTWNWFDLVSPCPILIEFLTWKRSSCLHHVERKIRMLYLERVSEGDEERMFDILEEDIPFWHDMTSLIAFHYCHFVQDFDGVDRLLRLMFSQEDLQEAEVGILILPVNEVKSFPRSRWRSKDNALRRSKYACFPWARGTKDIEARVNSIWPYQVA